MEKNKLKQFIYINGEMIPRAKAMISVLDHSFLYGIGVFETLRAYEGKILFIDKHINRLYRSAEAIFLDMPFEKKSISLDIYKTLKTNNLSDAYIRITVSMGEGEPGLDPSLCKRRNIVIYAKKFDPYPKQWYTNGVKVAVVSIIKSMSGSRGVPLKACNYLCNYLAKFEAKEKGAIEGIMLSRHGTVTEGTVSNVFIVKKGMLLTPPSGEDVLDGLTRNCIIDLASNNGIEIHESPFTRTDLVEAEECFITNTTFEVLPVTRIDDKKIGSGRPGEITKLVAELYKEEIKRNLLPCD